MYWLLILVLAAGAALAVQAAVNGRLGQSLGSPILASVLSFVIGLAGLLLYAVATRAAWPGAAALAATPRWAWLGGLLGALYVVTAITATPRLGVAVTMSLVVAGQMLASVVLDHYGLLGMPRQPLSWERLLGVALVIAGVVLVRRH